MDRYTIMVNGDLRPLTALPPFGDGPEWQRLHRYTRDDETGEFTDHGPVETATGEAIFYADLVGYKPTGKPVTLRLCRAFDMTEGE